jgi:Flp pilus assembly protein CpaB
MIGAVLAVLGFLAFVFFGNMGGSAHGIASGPGRDVVVASHDLGLRTKLDTGDLKIAKYADADFPPGGFARVDDLKGYVTAVEVKAGQPLTRNIVANSPDLVTGSASQYLPIPKGYVALTVPTGEQQGVAGWIQAGDYISVIAVVTQSTKSQNTRTVFTNLRVLKVGPADFSAGPNGNTRTAGPTSSLTLVVTQCQAEFINWFLANAQVRYTLESYNDYLREQPAVDSGCASVDAAKGVTYFDIAAKYPGIFSG